MSLREALDHALDPGPDFPSPALLHSIISALDEQSERKPAKRRRVAAGLAATVLLGTLVVAGLLLVRTARLQQQPEVTVPATSSEVSTTSRPVPAGPSAAGFLTASFVNPQAGWASQLAPSGVTHISRTLDGGATWVEVAQIHGLILTSPMPQFFSAGAAVLVGQPTAPPRFGIRVFATSDGVHWTQTEAPLSMGHLRKAWFVSDREGWVTAALGLNAIPNEESTLWHTSDAGAHWRRLTDSRAVPQLSEPRAQLSFETAWRGWLRGPGVLLRSIDSGRTWQRSSLPPIEGAVDAVGQPQADHLQVTTMSGSSHIFRTGDGGRTWQLQRQLALINRGIFLTADRWVFPSAGTNLRITEDGGQTFTTVQVPAPAGWRVSDVAAAPAGGMTAWLTDLGGAETGGQVPMQAIGASGAVDARSNEPADLHMQGTLPRFAIVRSVDGGQTWSAVAIPDLP